jgi:oligopeptide/dipeptide ABC transporter ATP-binding protein
VDLLRVNNLQVNFFTKEGVVSACDNISLSINSGESWCLVGESGCGKTIVALSMIRLLPGNAVIKGEIWYKGQELLSLKEEDMRRMRGKDIAMVFEQPVTCLNPVFTVGNQIAEMIRLHEGCSRKESREKAIELMDTVMIPSPRKRFGQYPHEFSGGMQQRVMIAIALACRPSLLIADEPTTSLDITIQMQIIELLKELIEKFNTSLFLITHDLNVVTELCQGVAVMYAGEIMETGNVATIFKEPRHPYTRALLGAISGDTLRPIKGSVPELTNLPDGCKFHPRCPNAQDICRVLIPEMKNGVRCHLWENI